MQIYASEAEQEQHEQAVEAIAEEFHCNIEEVQQVYERAYVALKSQASITDYLPLFVARRTRTLLRERGRA
jgi:hypothetical protein